MALNVASLLFVISDIVVEYGFNAGSDLEVL